MNPSQEESNRLESGSRVGTWGRVIHGQPGIIVIVELVCYLRNALVTAVARLEVEVRCPTWHL
jgi:hypothetical protein